MTEQEFIGFSFKLMLPIILSLLPVTALIWKLCTNITTLNVTLKELYEKNTIQDKRLDSHSERLDNIKDLSVENKLKLTDHEARIKTLESNKNII